MTMHVRGAHKISGLKQNYVDSSHIYQNDLVATLERCFGRSSNLDQGFGSGEKERNQKRLVVIVVFISS